MYVLNNLFTLLVLIVQPLNAPRPHKWAVIE